jgi:hypothetical protein
VAKGKTEFKAPNGLSPAEKTAYEKAASKSRGDFWPPKDVKPGAMFMGDFVAVEMKPNTLKKPKRGEEQEMQRLYVFKNEDATTKIWGAAVLDSEFDSLGAKPGDRILILYQGRAERGSKGKQPAKLFSAVKVVTPKERR